MISNNFMSNKNIISYFIFVSLFFLCNSLEALPQNVTTNLSFWRDISGWYKIEKEKSPNFLLEKMNKVMTGVVPWRMPVISGKDWSYNWGFYVWMLKGEALLQLEKSPAAYQAFLDAYSYMPIQNTPAIFSEDYYKWRLKIGEACHQLGRTLEAEWYFEEVLSSGLTNNSVFWNATKEYNY